MEAIGSDHEVEAACRPVVEEDLAVVGEGGDGVAEDVFHVVASGVVEDLAEIVAHDLDVPVGHRAEDLGQVDGHRPPAAFAVHGQPGGPGGHLRHAREHSHLFRDFHRWPEQIDRVAAGLAWRGCALHHRHAVPVPGEPVGQRRPGDAGA